MEGAGLWRLPKNTEAFKERCQAAFGEGRVGARGCDGQGASQVELLGFNQGPKTDR